MAETAYQVQYRQQFINGFEMRQSLLRTACTTEAVIKGNSAVFLVADSGSATAVTRGVNGLIPARADNLTQNTCTLTEQHDLVRKTGFNVFASQGDQVRIMQETSMGVVNRKVDDQIITELDTATNDTGSAVTASVSLVMKALTILGNNYVPFDGNIFGVISPAFYGYIMQAPEFASADYVDGKPFTGQSMMFKWANVNWIVHPRLTGAATSSEKCYMFHRSAIGSAVDVKGITADADYDREQDYSWARTTFYGGAKLLQNSGVVQVVHDGSAYVAS
jgi:hypothetical protein